MAKTHQLLATQTLASNSSSITFSNIPQNYQELQIVWTGKLTTSTLLYVIFNGDTFSNFYSYSFISTQNNNNRYANQDYTGHQLARCWFLGGDSNAIFMYIPGYSFYNSSSMTWGAELALANLGFEYDAGMWRYGGAIKSITFQAPGGSSIAANSVVSIYGVVTA